MIIYHVFKQEGRVEIGGGERVHLSLGEWSGCSSVPTILHVALFQCVERRFVTRQRHIPLRFFDRGARD